MENGDRDHRSSIKLHFCKDQQIPANHGFTNSAPILYYPIAEKYLRPTVNSSDNEKIHTHTHVNTPFMIYTEKLYLNKNKIKLKKNLKI